MHAWRATKAMGYFVLSPPQATTSGDPRALRPESKGAPLRPSMSIDLSMARNPIVPRRLPQGD